jgi:DNA-binding GntR family transcriptional regulator
MMGQPEKNMPTARAASGDVQAELELDLVLGRFRPRERLIEDDLMARFGAKRHVVRSALAELERIGLVERRPNKGAMVREYSPAEVEEIYSFRADLHRIAVERMALPLAPEIVGQMQELASRHEAAIDAGDLTEVIMCNNAFHDTLFDQCGNRFLAESIRHLGATSHAIRSYRVGDPELLRQAAEEHRQIIAAAAAGQRKLLAELCERHIQPSKEMYLRDRTLRLP